MKASEFTNEEILDEVPSAFVNKVVDRNQWKSPTGSKEPPKGQTASIWQHMADPNTVVKVVGGGEMKEVKAKHRRAAVAFVEFLVQFGKTSPHLPVVHGINADDPEVVQIRMETLYPFDKKTGRELPYLLEQLADYPDNEYWRNDVQRELKKVGLSEKNSAESLAACIILLRDNATKYAKKYKVKEFVLDLHEFNWMLSKDGVIVAADPWFAGW
jgi:hypothetical protein